MSICYKKLPAGSLNLFLISFTVLIWADIYLVILYTAVSDCHGSTFWNAYSALLLGMEISPN